MSYQVLFENLVYLLVEVMSHTCVSMTTPQHSRGVLDLFLSFFFFLQLQYEIKNKKLILLNNISFSKDKTNFMGTHNSCLW